jgi:hypothetical protein
MARFLPALIFLVASVKVSQAIHFTNQQWDVQQDQEFLLQWAYDQSDPINKSAWQVAIWLSEGNQWPINDGIILYNGMPYIADLLKRSKQDLTD